MPRFSSVASLSNRGIRRKRIGGGPPLQTIYTLQYTLEPPAMSSNPYNSYMGQIQHMQGNVLAVGLPIGRYPAYDTASRGTVLQYAVSTGALTRAIQNPDFPENNRNDRFGESVAVYSPYLFIGAPLENRRNNSNYNTASGVIYNYNLSTGAKNSDNLPVNVANARFGWGMAVPKGPAGNQSFRFIVGAQNGTVNASQQGQVYKLQMNNIGITHTFNDPTPLNYGDYGKSMAYSNNYFAIASNSTGLGRVDVTRQNTNNSHTFLYSLTSPTGSTAGEYGGDPWTRGGVDISPNEQYLAVGHPDANEAHLYNMATGTLLFTVTNPDTRFGRSVHVTNDYLMVSSSNSVYLYSTATGALVQIITEPSNTIDANFGYSMKAADGDWLAIGAPNQRNTPGGASYSGRIHMYKKSP